VSDTALTVAALVVAVGWLAWEMRQGRTERPVRASVPPPPEKPKVERVPRSGRDGERARGGR
jgi:hypothetical protein